MSKPICDYGDKSVYDPQDRKPDIVEEAELSKRDLMDHIDDKASEYAEEIGVDFWTAYQIIFEVLHDWVIVDFNLPVDVGGIIKQKLQELSDNDNS